MVKVSIIVPVYNVEKYIRKCLDSLINQTLDDLEFICINDGSTDKSLELLEQYANTDKRIKIYNQKNAGLSVTRNRGIEIATGEYIAFCDSDDWVDLDFYEKLYNAAEKNRADIAAASIIREKGNKQEKYYVFKDTYISEDYYEKLKICDIPEYNYVWNKIYKTSEYKKANLKFEVGLNYEDIAFTPQALFHLKRLITVIDTSYHYLNREDSIVHKKCNKPDSKKTMKIAEDFLLSKNIDIEKLKPKTKRLKIFGYTIIKKTQRKSNPYAITRFDKQKYT